MSEWITDRLPTEADADEYFCVYWMSIYNGVIPCNYEDIKVGEVWAPKPKLVPPKPYVKPGPKRWKPDVKSLYYCINWYGETSIKNYYGRKETSRAYDFGNCFETWTQAEEAARRVRETLLNYHKELNNDQMES